ncbi:DoxX family membrane protein [Streptomyces tsukubensis]|nr:DoxX family membrane protein [Streptomyces tsukubensis]
MGLFLLRLGTGGVLAAHGSQKLFGWFGGGGVEATGNAMESMGFTPGRANALAAGLGEAGGGALLALGLATPAAGAAAAGTMGAAAAVHAPGGFFAQGGGYEYPAFLGFAAAALSVTGPGRISLDHAMGHTLNKRWMMPAALVGCAAATLTVVAARNKQVRQKAQETASAEETAAA